MRSLFFALLLAGLIAAYALLGDGGVRRIEAGAGARVHISDGDTLRIERETIRLVAIDAPELRQNCATRDGGSWPCGKVAHARLARLAADVGLRCDAEATDRYGRALATCATEATSDIGQTLVREGMAASYGGLGEGRYAGDEALARLARRGIWQGPFQRPAEWRRDNPRRPAVGGVGSGVLP